MFQNTIRIAQQTQRLRYRNQLMLYQEIVALRSEIRTTQSNALCGHNVELFSVSPGGIVT
jgi:hypothetical protein